MDHLDLAYRTTSALFGAFLALTVCGVVALAARYLPRRATLRFSAVLAAWLAYVGLIAYAGVVRNTELRPPGIVFVVLPALAFIVAFFARSRTGGRIAVAFPLWVLLASQSFRLGVELFLHQLSNEGLVPRMLTFEGSNVDIFIGASAPFVAWFAARGNAGARLALFWNALGLLSIANVATRALLSAPGPLHVIATDVPNVAFGTLPYTYVPGFFVPLAIAFHVLSIRAATSRLRAGATPRLRPSVGRAAA